MCWSLTNLAVSLHMRGRTLPCVGICSRPQLAVQKRLGSFVTTLRCSTCSSTGHCGRLSGRISIWRSGTARCLTYAQRWTSWWTSGQLPGIHALSGCDTVSYPYGKGNKSSLNVLMDNAIDGLQDVLGDPDITQGQLKATAGAFFLAFYGQKTTDSLNTARYKMYMSRKKPPTDSNLQLHLLRAHRQMMLWKTADQTHSPVEARDIRRFGWDVKEGGVVTPYVVNATVAP